VSWGALLADFAIQLTRYALEQAAIKRNLGPVPQGAAGLRADAAAARARVEERQRQAAADE
jgi:hypothetical protein